MSKAIKLDVKSRTENGSAAVRKLRRRGLVPGIVYGPGMTPQPIMLEAHAFDVLLHHHASEHLMFDLCVDRAAPLTVILEEVQRDALRGSMTHLDFRAISMDTPIEVEVGIELRGVPVGVHQQGGVVEQLLHSIVVRCLPADLQEVIELDISGLEVGDSLTVADLPLDRARYRFRVVDDIAVVTVAAPRVQEAEEAAEEEAAAAGEEPERVKEESSEAAPEAASAGAKEAGRERA